MRTSLYKTNYNFIKKFISLQNYSSECHSSYDIAVIGGGIVGSAAAREILCRNATFKCAIIEKENSLGMHQSTHNSGVIHAGIYYKPGSIKAELCTQGMHLLYQYLDEKSIPYKKVGKLIVATEAKQLNTLEDLYKRGVQNNVKDIEIINSNAISSVEPNCVGLKAIYSPHTGIVDYGVVTQHYGIDFVNLGGKIHNNFEVKNISISTESCYETSCDIIKYPIMISSSKGEVIHASFVLTCAGLYADKVSMMQGGAQDPAIIPFRGEYLQLKPEKANLVKGNIYPVPDTRFPFLGVHFTPKLDGSVWLGPNAVLAFKREGYRYSDISTKDLWYTLNYKGFHRLASKYFLFGIKEHMKSLILSMQVNELRKFIPNLSANDVMRGPSGVRAQAVAIDGTLIEDFVFDSDINSRVLHCRNAPSPAATSSLAIGRVLANKVLDTIKSL